CVGGSTSHTISNGLPVTISQSSSRAALFVSRTVPISSAMPNKPTITPITVQRASPVMNEPCNAPEPCAIHTPPSARRTIPMALRIHIRSRTLQASTRGAKASRKYRRVHASLTTRSGVRHRAYRQCVYRNCGGRGTVVVLPRSRRTIATPVAREVARGRVDPRIGPLGLGISGDIPISGRWNGGARPADVGVVRGNMFHLRGGPDPIPFGAGIEHGDIPIVGDWTGDGTSDVGVVRGNQFLLRGKEPIRFGAGIEHGDIPIIVAWDGTHY